MVKKFFMGLVFLKITAFSSIAVAENQYLLGENEVILNSKFLAWAQNSTILGSKAMTAGAGYTYSPMPILELGFYGAGLVSSNKSDKTENKNINMAHYGFLTRYHAYQYKSFAAQLSASYGMGTVGYRSEDLDDKGNKTYKHSHLKAISPSIGVFSTLTSHCRVGLLVGKRIVKSVQLADAGNSDFSSTTYSIEIQTGNF